MTKLTRSYLGGILTGVGLCFVIANLLVFEKQTHKDLATISGFALSLIGRALARSGQQREEDAGRLR